MLDEGGQVVLGVGRPKVESLPNRVGQFHVENGRGAVPLDSAAACGELHLNPQLNPVGAHDRSTALQDLLAGVYDRDTGIPILRPQRVLERADQEVPSCHLLVPGGKSLRRQPHFQRVRNDP